MERRARFDYVTPAGAATLTGALPQRPWDYDVPVHGSARWTATGVPVPDISREDMDLDVLLRFEEPDWPVVEAFLLQVQDCQAFDYFPDALDTATSYEVYLVRPHAGEEITPQRMGDYVPGFDLTLTLRKVDGTLWALEYHALRA